MNWDSVILQQWQPNELVIPAIDQLFDAQRQQWPTFAKGEASLATLRTKTLHLNGATVTVQANPSRKRSTHAKTDSQSIAQRRCFLCPENMPAEEKGLGFKDLVILPNPFPILPQHCTIPTRNHSPQQIEGRVETLLKLADAVGPEMFVFYNGPQCGASAPDHLHFQACLADQVPVLTESAANDYAVGVQGHESFGRRYVSLVDSDLKVLRDSIERCIGILREVTTSEAEPMLNLMVHARADHLLAVLFPRAVHRPACYFAEGSDRIAVSPATLEMAGVLVCAEPDHFDKLNEAEAPQIYHEVSLDPERFTQLMDRLR